MVEVVSPFAVGLVAGGKGGVVVMMMVWGPGGPVYALRLSSLTTALCYPTPVHRRVTGMGTLTEQVRPPPQPQIPHITPVQTHGAEVDALANFRSGI